MHKTDPLNRIHSYDFLEVIKNLALSHEFCMTSLRMPV